MTQAITKGEREDLKGLIKKREKVMRAEAEKRSAELLADFDAQLAKVYHFDEDAIWKASVEEAEKVIDKAKSEIAARCLKLGIPPEFAPSLELGWRGRGQNAIGGRRSELRQMAKSRIAALEKEAFAQIERISLDAQTNLVSQALTTDQAKQFLASFGSVDQLMPIVRMDEVTQLIEQKRQSNRHLGYHGGYDA